MGRHDFHPDDAGVPVDLTAIVADDALLDALGRHRRTPASEWAGAVDGSIGGPARTPVLPGRPQPDLTDLFATWRAALEADPLPEPPTVDSVVLALRHTARQRSLRSMLGVAVAICALLVGSAGIGARTARPGDVLWPVTQVLWSDRAESVVAGDTTRVALGQARMALDAGLTSQARSALVVASTVLPRVAERDGHQNLKADLDNLWSTLDWVQQQHAAPADAQEQAAPSPTAGPSAAASVGNNVTSSPAGSASSSPPGTSSGSDPTSSRPTAVSTATAAEPSSMPPVSSAPVPPAAPSWTQPPATSAAPTVPATPTTTPIAPTVPSPPASPATPTPTPPSSPAPSTDAPTDPSTPSTPSEPSSTAPSATQEVLPATPTASATSPAVVNLGEQSADPAPQVQQPDPGPAGSDG